MHFVYILHSKQCNRFYIGETCDPVQRLMWHNEHIFKQSSTKKATDWNIRKIIAVENRSEARIVEQYIKSMKSARFISKLVDDLSFYERFKEIVLQKFNISIT